MPDKAPDTTAPISRPSQRQTMLKAGAIQIKGLFFYPELAHKSFTNEGETEMKSADRDPEVRVLAERLYDLMALAPLRRDEILRAVDEARAAFADLPVKKVASGK